MPTYEYTCTACQNEWEFEQSIKDNALTECPRCHEQTAKRQISRGTGFILKGSGWYSDLYSSSSNKAPATESSSSDAKASTTEAKPGADKGGKGDGGSSTPASSSGSGSSTPAAPAAPAKSDASPAAA